MLDKIKDYIFNVALKRYVPIATMAGIGALGTLLAAHQGLLESWGVNYIADWSSAWLNAHQITGPVLLIELDTTSTAVIALVIGLATFASRAVEHHVVTPIIPVLPTPPLPGTPK